MAFISDVNLDTQSSEIQQNESENEGGNSSRFRFQSP